MDGRWVRYTVGHRTDECARGEVFGVPLLLLHPPDRPPSFCAPPFNVFFARLSLGTIPTGTAVVASICPAYSAASTSTTNARDFPPIRSPAASRAATVAGSSRIPVLTRQPSAV